MSGDTTWPVSLTRSPRLGDLSEEAPDVLLRSEVDVGPAKLRRRFTGDARRFSVALDLTRSELTTFDVFFRDTTEGGALSFDWKHPRTGAAAVFRFLRPPTYRPQAPRTASGGEWWRVTFDMEMLPGTDSDNPPPSDATYLPEGGGYFDRFPIEEEEGEIIDGEEEPAIIAPLVFEATTPPPDFVPDLLLRGYTIIIDEEDEPDEEDSSIVTGAGVSSTSRTLGSGGSGGSVGGGIVIS